MKPDRIQSADSVDQDNSVGTAPPTSTFNIIIPLVIVGACLVALALVLTAIVVRRRRKTKFVKEVEDDEMIEDVFTPRGTTIVDEMKDVFVAKNIEPQEIASKVSKNFKSFF